MRRRFVDERGEARPVQPALIEKTRVIAIGRERKHLKPVRMAREDVERIDADRAGRPEPGHTDHTFSPTMRRPSTNSGTAAVTLSMRSRMPPWPGMKLPLSLSPA